MTPKVYAPAPSQLVRIIMISGFLRKLFAVPEVTNVKQEVPNVNQKVTDDR